MIHTFLTVFVHFVARLGNDSHVLRLFCAFRCPISGGEVLVAKPVAARGFMSGRGPLADVAKDKLVCPAARQTVGGTK